MIKCGYNIDEKCDCETLDNDFKIGRPITDTCVGESECFYYDQWLDKIKEENENCIEHIKKPQYEKQYNELEPSHYNSGKYDVIWFCEYHNLSFTVGNIIKYVFRAGKKDKSKEIEGLKKAKKYIDRRIEFLEGE